MWKNVIRPPSILRFESAAAVYRSQEKVLPSAQAFLSLSPRAKTYYLDMELPVTVFHCVVAPVSIVAFLLVLLRSPLLKALRQLAGSEDKALDEVQLPPGPKPLPLLGNVHQLPMAYQEKTFAEWAKVYGTLCSIVDREKAAYLSPLRRWADRAVR